LAAIGSLVATGDSIFEKVATMAEKMVRKHGPSVTAKRETRDDQVPSRPVDIVAARHGRDSRLRLVGNGVCFGQQKRFRALLVEPYT
jgi:hypothetical protein